MGPRTALLVLVASLLSAAVLFTDVQAQQAADTLRGTLAKVRNSGAITIGYRDSAVPFSFLNARKEPVGYAIDLCRELVRAIEDTVNRSLVITRVPVTSDSRIDVVERGMVDLECGSTTNNAERQMRVSFSPTIFVSGTKLLVRKGSPIKSFRDLTGKRVAVAAETTNEKALRDLSEKFKLGIRLMTSRDRADSFDLLERGEADAFASDNVLLHGLIAHDAAKADYEIARDYLSFEPYGIMYRKGDAPLGKVVDDTFRVLAEDGEIDRQYKRWFLRTLPTGQNLDLPMSARLEAIIRTIASKGRGAASTAAAISDADARACRNGRPRRADAQRSIRSAG